MLIFREFLFSYGVVYHIETGQTILYVKFCGFHTMVMIEQHTWRLIICNPYYFHTSAHIWSQSFNPFVNILIEEELKVKLIEKSVIAWAFVSIGVEPRERVSIINGSNLQPMYVWTNGH